MEVLQVRMVEEQAHNYLEAPLPSLAQGRSPRFSLEQDHHKTTLSPVKTLFSQRVALELQYRETKWAALMPYAKTAQLLKELLPIHQKLNAATIRNHLGQIAQQIDTPLSFAYDEGSPRERAILPKPEGPIVMGVNGGYVRDWKEKNLF